MKELVRREIMQVLADLPEYCYSRLPTTGEPILIKRGSTGYWPAHTRIEPESLNAGLTAAQVAAMEAGSHFGFDIPGADPLNYPELAQSSWYPADRRARWFKHPHYEA